MCLEIDYEKLAKELGDVLEKRNYETVEVKKSFLDFDFTKKSLHRQIRKIFWSCIECGHEFTLTIDPTWKSIDDAPKHKLECLRCKEKNILVK